MGIVDDALERADQEAFTREPPRSLKARINFLMKQLRTTKAVAREIGVSQRSVERYIKGERKHPPKAVSDRIDTAVRSRWQPRVHATCGSSRPQTRPASPWRRGPGSATPHPSARPTTDGCAGFDRAPSPPYARRLFDAQQQGADDARLRDIVAEGLQEIYFKDGGRRAQDLEVELTDVDYFDVSY